MDGTGVQTAMKGLEKVHNLGMCWVSGMFKATLIGALEYFRDHPPVRIESNISIFKAALRVNKLSESHPIKILTRFARISAYDSVRIYEKPMKIEEFTAFNLVPHISARTDEQFTFTHEEQIKGARVVDLFEERIIKLLHDPNVRPLNTTVVEFQEMDDWRSRPDAVIITTDELSTHATSVISIWKDNVLIHEESARVQAFPHLKLRYKR
ncbi:hypothetical protein AX15_001743 [Amanita polypyramis BW_CC]|nr:hypothetical protein AX15_001743 [Amanita polypyramis BW_CC]